MKKEKSEKNSWLNRFASNWHESCQYSVQWQYVPFCSGKWTWCSDSESEDVLKVLVHHQAFLLCKCGKTQGRKKLRVLTKLRVIWPKLRVFCRKSVSFWPKFGNWKQSFAYFCKILPKWRENLEKTQGLSTKNSGFGIYPNLVQCSRIAQKKAWSNRTAHSKKKKVK